MEISLVQYIHAPAARLHKSPKAELFALIIHLFKKLS